MVALKTAGGSEKKPFLFWQMFKVFVLLPSRMLFPLFRNRFFH